MDDGIGRSGRTREQKNKEPGFLKSLKFDWSLLLRGLKRPDGWGLLKGKLSDLSFQENEMKQSTEDRLAQLSEAKRHLNQRIEKVNRQLELLELGPKGDEESPMRAQLISEGQQATRELQIIEAELAQLRRMQKSQVTKGQASLPQGLRLR